MACRDVASKFFGRMSPPLLKLRRGSLLFLVSLEAKVPFFFAGVPRRSFELVGALLPAFAKALARQPSLPRFSRSEGWWRRRESNPRPETFHNGFYIHSLNSNFRRFKSPSGRMLERLACKISSIQVQAARINYPANRRPPRVRRNNPVGR